MSWSPKCQKYKNSLKFLLNIKDAKYGIWTGEQSDFFKFSLCFYNSLDWYPILQILFSLADGHTGSGQWRWVVLSKQVLQAATHPGRPESIEWFIEDQAFSASYDPPPRQQVVSLSQSYFVSPFELTYGRGEVVVEELNLKTARKPGSL